MLDLILAGKDVGLDSPSVLLQKMKKLQELSANTVTGCFEWIDGLLIQALEEGHWILIDNVNFCNPTVLDRLNPLLEPNGVLMVNERGLIDGEIKVIKPHRNFRIFLAMDPKNGEISRAMRNRGVEITMFEIDIDSLDTLQILSSYGILPSLAKRMTAFQKRIFDDIGTSWDNPLTLRNLIDWAKIISEQLQRGIGFEISVTQGAEQIYIRGRYNLDEKSAIRKIFSETFAEFTMYG